MNLFQKIIDISKGEFAKKTILSFILKILGLVLSYVFIVIVSRYFGAEAYGRFSIAFTVLNIFALVFALGIPDATIKIVSDQTINSKFHFRKTSLRLIFISALVGSFILYSLSEFLSSFYKDDSLNKYFVICAIILTPLILLRLNYETLRGKNEIIRFGFLSHIIPFLVASVVLLIAFYYYKIVEDSAVIVAYAFGVVIAFIFSLFWLKKDKNAQLRLKTYSARQLMHYSFPMLATSSFIFIMGWTDTLMLGYYNDKADVGIYNVVIRIARIAIIAITSINLVLAPKISELYSNSEFSKMRELITKSTKLIFIVTVPLVLVIIFANKFVLSIFGEDFIVGGVALIIVMISQLFNAISGSSGQVMNMTGNHKKLRNFTIYTAILNITLNFILIPLYGILGAAIATATSIIVLNLSSAIFVKRKLGIVTYFNPFHSIINRKR
ncbi:flippase [Xanthomarina sp. F1114]|uniref:flippase n=1 Tax=Xanthomarina sp. F1114 TaxID=2996019 RepID=UPI00225E2FEA|nr:flippase [Xanthomarina sp. F1114]MCX7546562.1 flippase [Xanthomarina sp. F1114]